MKKHRGVSGEQIGLVGVENQSRKETHALKVALRLDRLVDSMGTVVPVTCIKRVVPENVLGKIPVVSRVWNVLVRLKVQVFSVRDPPVFPSTRPGATTIGLPCSDERSEVPKDDRIVPESSSHGPPPSVGETGAGLSAVPYASLSWRCPLSGTPSERMIAVPNALKVRLSFEATGPKTST